MASHTRLSPGIEFNEIDRSRYDTKPDYALTSTTVFMTGFTARGEDYTTQWINSINTFNDLYGMPRNEPEQYLYNSVYEILARGGECIVSKLPYDNDSKDRFTVANYKFFTDLQSDDDLPDQEIYISDLSSFDQSIKKFAEISSCGTEKISMETLDKYRTSNSVNTSNSGNTIKIVDITRCDYGKASLVKKDGTVKDVECIGVMPVLVGSVNAMFFNGPITTYTQISAGEERTARIENYTPASNIRCRDDKDGQAIDFSEYAVSNFDIPVSAATVRDQSISMQATQMFPFIPSVTNQQLDKRNMKNVGVAVFKLYIDPANQYNVCFSLAEFFSGSLDRNSKDSDTGASNYIGNIVNARSKYINFFANIQINDAFREFDALVVRRQTLPVLGWHEYERVPHIDYVKSIVEPLTMIFERLQDPNQVNIDIVVDAGITNIAQYSSSVGADDAKTNPDRYDKYNSEAYPFVQKQFGEMEPWPMTDQAPSVWSAIMRKFDSFCKYTRRDCIFIADGYRPMVLEGNQKRVRATNLGSTIENTICDKMRLISGLNSSYSAGYLNWFLIADEYSGDNFWMPPSAKAAGIYINTDVYFHKWNAPAGIIRGKVRNVLDTSFDPKNDEAGKIYQQAWNYAVNYPLEGIVMEGQKTMQINKTALDRVNVRRLMLYIEKSVIAIARRFLYEGNTPFMRQRFVDSIKPIFDDAKNGDGISDYAIRCDDTINTVDVIERNEMRCVMAIKPVKAIEWIKLGFIVTNQSANVNEEVLK